MAPKTTKMADAAKAAKAKAKAKSLEREAVRMAKEAAKKAKAEASREAAKAARAQKAPKAKPAPKLSAGALAALRRIVGHPGLPAQAFDVRSVRSLVAKGFVVETATGWKGTAAGVAYLGDGGKA
jgi:septal ring factor EnvC (AmiA/AmiB activator)